MADRPRAARDPGLPGVQDPGRGRQGRRGAALRAVPPRLPRRGRHPGDAAGRGHDRGLSPTGGGPRLETRAGPARPSGRARGHAASSRSSPRRLLLALAVARLAGAARRAGAPASARTPARRARSLAFAVWTLLSASFSARPGAPRTRAPRSCVLFACSTSPSTRSPRRRRPGAHARTRPSSGAWRCCRAHRAAVPLPRLRHASTGGRAASSATT